jgi:hypothetical protein
MNNVAKSKIDWSFARYLAICAVSALALAPLLQPAYHGKSDAMTALVTVFTVLSGFMLAVIALAADGRNLRRRDWKQDTYFLREIRDRLARYRIMFHLYLVVPALAILAHIEPAWGKGVQSIAEGLVLFLAIFALLWSFRIPGEITSAYVKQLQQAIKDHRDEGHQKLLD